MIRKSHEQFIKELITIKFDQSLVFISQNSTSYSSLRLPTLSDFDPFHLMEKGL